MARDVTPFGSLIQCPDGRLEMDLVIGEGQFARRVRIELGPAEIELLKAQQSEPVKLDLGWVFRDVVVKCEPGVEETVGRDHLLTRIKHRVLRDERRWARIEREIEAFENLDRLPAAQRERIPDGVRLFVWQRDGGKCIQCASQKNLEFDHIIPVAKGGSNTERNIRLLCEPCNRQKGAEIA